MAASVAVTVSVNPQGVPAEGKATVTAVITNTGDTATTLTSVRATAKVRGSQKETTPVSLGVPPIGPGQNITLAAADGSITLTWDAAPHIAGPHDGPYAFQWVDLGCEILCADGEAVRPSTPARLCCNSFPNLQIWASKGMDFSDFERSMYLGALL